MLTRTCALLAAMLAASGAYGSSAVFTLDGTYDDTSGTWQLTPEGGTLGPSGYTFGPNQGLSIASVLRDPETYTITLTFALDDVSEYRKIIDFGNRRSDDGMYFFGGRVGFYYDDESWLAGETIVGAGTMLTLEVRRESWPTWLLSWSVNGIHQRSYSDPYGHAVFSGEDAIIRLFQDDLETESMEASSGVVEHVRIDGVVPEPGMAVLCLIAAITSVRRPRTRRP